MHAALAASLQDEMRGHSPWDVLRLCRYPSLGRSIPEKRLLTGAEKKPAKSRRASHRQSPACRYWPDRRHTPPTDPDNRGHLAASVARFSAAVMPSVHESEMSCHPPWQPAAPCVACEHENRHVIRRIITPPSPSMTSSGQGPRTGPNMFPSEESQAPIFSKTSGSEIIVDTGRSAAFFRKSCWKVRVG